MDTKESLQKLTDCLGEATKVLSVLVNNAEFRNDPSSGSARMAVVRPGLVNATPLNRDNQSSGLALPSLRPTNTSTSIGQGRLLGEQTLKTATYKSSFAPQSNFESCTKHGAACVKLRCTAKAISNRATALCCTNLIISLSSKKPKLENKLQDPLSLCLCTSEKMMQIKS